MIVIPGQYRVTEGDIEINVGRKTVDLLIINRGDRPIQVGSHYHFYEVNNGLDFDREQALGMRLNIAAGTAVRFEPGEEKPVQLVEFGGTKAMYGFQNRTNGTV